IVDTARQLAAAGQHAEVIAYLGARKGSELADSSSLALLYGTAQARLGRHEEGLRWVDLALDQARRHAEPAVERHALNARGAIARALVEADRAVAAAETAGDRTLWAQALRGRAEIRVVRGELELARRELDQVRDIRGQLSNPVGEAEDLRVAASLLVADGDL